MQAAADPVASTAESGVCEALRGVFGLLGKRWNGLIIVTLLDGVARFSELVRRVPGLSERVLAERLGELAAAGLVVREVDGGPPVSVRYALTARGEALRPALEALERWGRENLVSNSTPRPGRDLTSDRLDRVRVS